MLKRWPNLREVLFLLFPMVLTMTLELSIGLVDTLMLGRYDAYHLAAVGLASSLWLPIGCFLIGMSFGLTPLITRHLHGKQIRLVNIYMSQAVGVCFFLGLAAILLVAFVAPLVVPYMATEQVTREVTIGYLWLISPVIPMLGMMTAYKNLYESAGRPHFPMLVAFISLLLNIFFNYVLIFGNFGFPEMGAEGAAIASSLSVWLSVLYFFIYDRFINKRPLFTKLVLPYVRKCGLLLSVGVPAGFAFSFEVALFSSLMWLISSFGDYALGAGQIIMSYTSILFTPMMAMSAVTAIVIAKALANEGVNGVRQRMKVIVGLGMGYFFLCFTITQVFNDEIPFLYTANSEVAIMAANILVVTAFYQFSDVLQTVFTGALRGFRDTRFSMIAFGVSLFGLSMPLGYWLSHYSPWADTIGVLGFYMGLFAGLTLLSALLILRFRFVYKRAQTRLITKENNAVAAA
ncbi:MATE family efflux transporter [Marinomonas sp. 2405UD68-3]|uniref:MATE family efflux transporter n=1 Tax=Marinomonas sp. 2405UD68-3 TaxID=3391835 RepID=UPI0039C985AE